MPPKPPMRSSPRRKSARRLVRARSISDCVGPSAMKRRSSSFNVCSTRCRRHVLLDVRGDDEEPGDLERHRARARAVCDLVAVDEPLVQARSLAPAEDRADHRQQVGVRRAVGRHVPRLLQPRLRDLVVHDVPATVGARGDPGAGPRQSRAGRDVTEVALRLLARGGDVDVAREHQHRVGRPVVRAEPLLHVVERGCVQVFHRTDRQRVVRVADGEARSEQGLEDAAIRTVLALALLVLHDAPLLVEPRLVDGL